ncbi:MAG: response regulator transcription factor [Lachnospiraceae bacterium]|nr:response regulator transcription factor [Lachnospiraceae bacterium]MBQ7833258.1 response regulator transcription factor [Lachnospiraceae bacterium]
MYRVVICDDEATSLQINQILTEQVLEEAGIEYEIATFDDMRKMTAALSDEKAEYDVLLCDILAVGMNGIEAAKELRRLGEKLPIIFISSTAEFALEGYSVNALRYLQKPIDIEKLREALMEAHQNSEDGEALKFQVADRFYKIPFSDIDYLESCGRDTDIITKDERISVHMKFSDMEKRLPADMFLRCHRSYIINLAQAKDLARYRFLTKKGVEIPVSQLQYNETKRRFVKFQ